MRIHFIAVGGSAMHNLALALHDNGHQVSGSDDVIFEPSRGRLAKAGLLPAQMGWSADRIHADIDIVILGMHAKPDNPELARAKELGLRILSYPEYLYEHSREKTRVVIAGSHGKTTITSMILHVLKYWDKDADFMVGAQLEGFDRMVRLTDDNDFIVLEGDEYLSSALDRRPKFHAYKPNIALLSGIAWDHINVFPTFEVYREQFQIFLDTIVPGGSITYNEEDPEVRAMLEDLQAPIRKFPYRTPDYDVSQGKTLLQTPEGPMPLRIFGRHNLSNLAGAQWICQQMGVDEADFYEAMATFSGASKRLQALGGSKERQVFKDFAHSPSKVKATTAAVREQYPDRKLTACLELHTYSSLNAEFLEEYRHTLDQADRAIVFYIPDSLRIKGLPAIEPEAIRSAFGRKDLEVYVETEALDKALHDPRHAEGVLLLMSSGNYGGLDLESLTNGKG